MDEINEGRTVIAVLPFAYNGIDFYLEMTMVSGYKRSHIFIAFYDYHPIISRENVRIAIF